MLLYVTVNIICEELLIFFSIMMKKWLLLKNIPIKSAKIDILFMTQTAEKPYPLEPHIPI